MAKWAAIIRDWMLPGAIVLGTTLYLVYHFTPALHAWGGWLHPLASEGQRTVIALLLFFQFVKISPHDLKPCSWHWKALFVQVAAFLLLAAGVLALRQVSGGSGLVSGGSGLVSGGASSALSATRMLLECAMLCFICPTAAAAGVITDRLGGDLAATVSYVVMINVAATFLIPLVIPVVNPSSDLGFWAYVGHIAWKVFPILILPGLAAWIIRYTTHRLQRILMRWAGYSFYIWGVGLTLAMVLATRALLLSNLGPWAVAGIVAVSVLCCFVQFFVGRRIGAGKASGGAGLSSEAITPGQALGQKNTGFLIWLGYNYMTPVTSVAGGLYAIWQNLFNSWELYRKEHPATQ